MRAFGIAAAVFFGLCMVMTVAGLLLDVRGPFELFFGLALSLVVAATVFMWLTLRREL